VLSAQNVTLKEVRSDVRSRQAAIKADILRRQKSATNRRERLSNSPDDNGHFVPYVSRMTERAPSALILPPRPDRLPLIREAFRLEWFTIAWMVIEAVVALGAGITAGNLVLLAFGVDSVIELAAAGVASVG